MKTQTKLFIRFQHALCSLCLVGFLLHLLDIVGLRLNFLEMNVVWKLWTLFLLVFDLVAAIGLFKRRWWGELTFITVAVTQLIAYTQFPDTFGNQNFLIYFHMICLALYAAIKAEWIRGI